MTLKANLPTSGRSRGAGPSGLLHFPRGRGEEIRFAPRAAVSRSQGHPAAWGDAVVIGDDTAGRERQLRLSIWTALVCRNGSLSHHFVVLGRDVGLLCH